MNRGPIVRSARPALLAVLLCTGLLAGCTNEGDRDEPAGRSAASPTPPPTLEQQWSIAGLNSNPEAVGAHHWMTYQEFTSGVGRGMSSSPGPTLLVDTRNGKAHAPTVEPERFPCRLPAVISENGIVPIFWAAQTLTPGGSSQSEDCTRITVLNAGTGKTLWRDDSLDLSGLAPRRVAGANERTVAVVDSRGRSRCFASRTGARQASDEPPCVALTERLTHAELPTLVDPEGKAAPLTPLWSYDHEYDSGPTEVGRTGEVLLVRAPNHLLENGGIKEYRWLVRAHDLKTGETLWQDDDLTPDPHQDDAWARSETYFAAPSGVVRVSYEHPDDPDEMSATPMVLTAVDPLTGKDVKPIGQIEGGWFNHQFGDMTVALTEQQRGLRSTISGFELPSW